MYITRDKGVCLVRLGTHTIPWVLSTAPFCEALFTGGHAVLAGGQTERDGYLCLYLLPIPARYSREGDLPTYRTHFVINSARTSWQACRFNGTGSDIYDIIWEGVSVTVSDARGFTSRIISLEEI